MGIQITWVPPFQLNGAPIPLPPLLSCQWGRGSCVRVISLKEQHQGQLIGSCRILIQLAQPLFLWARKSTVANVFCGEGRVWRCLGGISWLLAPLEGHYKLSARSVIEETQFNEFPRHYFNFGALVSFLVCRLLEFLESSFSFHKIVIILAYYTSSIL